MVGFTFVDTPRSGAENMAIDQHLLELAAQQQTVILRLYTWSVPTLSLGYFQKHEDRQLQTGMADMDVVRRATGGGAIVHHYDWTYSIAVPNSRLESDLGASQSLYDCVHVAVVDWLSELGLQAFQWDQPVCKSGTSDCSFLCFDRRSRGDVVVGQAKVLGSAQRRGKGALLQHGSLLLARSPFASSLVGVRDILQLHEIRNAKFHCAEFHRRLVHALNAKFRFQLTEIDRLTAVGESPVDIRKFSDPSWSTRF